MNTELVCLLVLIGARKHGKRSVISNPGADLDLNATQRPRQLIVGAMHVAQIGVAQSFPRGLRALACFSP